MKKKVGIVLVNYKDYAEVFLSACRDSLRRQDYGRENFQVYIIDNASTEESVKFLEDLYPEAIIVPRSDGNYVAANNLGFKQAILNDCQYLVAVNMDTEMERDWLSELVLSLEKNLEVGISQAKVLLYDKENKERRINTLGNVLHFLGFGTTTFYRETDREIKGYPEIKGYASGCCFICRQEVFKKIDGWNEEYYMYHDDIEFSLKTRLSGYKIILAPESVIYHKYEFSRSRRMLYFMERNRYLLIFSFYPCRLILLLLPVLLAMDIAMMFYAILKGWFKTWLLVHLYFLKPGTWWKIFSIRRKIKKLKQTSMIRISQDMVGKLEFLEIDNFILRYLANPLLNAYWRLIKKII